MFLPSSVAENQKKIDERKAAFKNIEQWSLEMIPAAIRNEAQVSIQEVNCGDPACSPVDTAITIQFSRCVCRGLYHDQIIMLLRSILLHLRFLDVIQTTHICFLSLFRYSGCNGIFGLPVEAKDVTLETLKSNFPTPEVLEKWHAGEDADWPPMDEEAEAEFPELRFDVGTRVLCRIGPDVNKDWAPGEIVLLWYREPNWPQGSFAPYKIKLDDGRNIFAPGDMDQVIRLDPSATSNE